MSVRDLIQDAATLYRDRRYLSSFTLALITLEVTARARFHPSVRSSARRFKAFLADEAQSSIMFNIKHGVDLPPQPQRREAPKFDPPAIADNNWGEWKVRLAKWGTEFAKCQAETDKAYEHYKQQVMDVGDDFCGPGNSYLGKPRLVTTAGILYQARCELVHEGNLSTIQVIEHEDGFMVSGCDPITFSSSYINAVLAIVVHAKENQALSRQHGS